MKSPVYFYPIEQAPTAESLAAGMMRLYERAGFENSPPPGGMFQGEDFVAIKQHFGESGRPNCLKPPIAATMARQLKAQNIRPFLTDTTTLYSGLRMTGPGYLKVMAENGFTMETVGCPAVIADGLRGCQRVRVNIDGKHYQHVSIGAAIAEADGMIALTHVTGHCGTGLGGTIKNLGMGCASRSGKLTMHSHGKPSIDPSSCTACGACARDCPAEAITVEKVARIDKNKCLGCGQCFTVCREGAIKNDWSEVSAVLEEKIAEYALGAVAGKEKKSLFFNFLADVTKNCDCIRTPEKPSIGDVGILAGRDAVAVDAAAMDLLDKRAGKDFFRTLWPDIDARIQLRAAEDLGLGSQQYKLERIE